MSEIGAIQCAKVYINVDKLFIIKCCRCFTKFNKWLPLEKHILKCYNDLPQSALDSATEDELGLDEHIKEEEEENGHPAKLQATEMVLIAGEYEDDCDLANENDCEANETTDDSDDSGSGIFHISESSRVFYNLGRTQKHIVLDFIDIIREHPCYWDPNHVDYNIREKRVASSTQISVELKERWNINISEQTARASVLHMCRWFEREYMRSMCQPEVMSLYPDYYGKLYEFLPRDHLKWAECDECPRKFKSDDRLLAHKHNRHNGSVPYQCRHCKLTFAFRSTLRRHENRHTMEHVYACDQCDYRCSAKADILMHRTRHTDVRPYTCEMCGAAYKSSTSLNVHRRSHKPPRLKCPVCGKMFREQYRLKRHMFVHAARNERTTGVNIFKCPVCEKYFSRSATLQKHMQQQHGLSPQEVAPEPCESEEKYDIDKYEKASESDDDQEMPNIEFFSCPPCNLDFLCPQAYEKHRVRFHCA